MHDRAIYAQVAALHIASIDRGFLPQLGPRFLTLLYEAMDADPRSILIVEVEQGKVAGFVSGGVGLKHVYRALLGRLPSVVWSLLPALLSPRKIFRIAEILLHARSEEAPDLPAAELFSIAVAPFARGTGCAQKLYLALCRHFRDQGILSFKIVVGRDLGPAHAFYRKMGAEPVSEVEIHADQASTIYVQQNRD